MDDGVRSCGGECDGFAEVLSCVIVQEAAVVDDLRGGGTRDGVRSRHVESVCRYIDAHYEEVVSLAHLASVVGCSRRYLAGRFRCETGETVHSYLTRVRLNHAVKDVQAGDKVEAVMLGVGIRGKANFYRHFKARFGVTPAEYRAGEHGACVRGDAREGFYDVTLALTGSA